MRWHESWAVIHRLKRIEDKTGETLNNFSFNPKIFSNADEGLGLCDDSRWMGAEWVIKEQVFSAAGMEGWAAPHKAMHTCRHYRESFGVQTMRDKSRELKLEELYLEMENLLCCAVRAHSPNLRNCYCLCAYLCVCLAVLSSSLSNPLLFVSFLLEMIKGYWIKQSSPLGWTCKNYFPWWHHWRRQWIVI